MKKVKRIWALTIAATMLVTMLPGNAMAASTDVKITDDAIAGNEAALSDMEAGDVILYDDDMEDSSPTPETEDVDPTISGVILPEGDGDHKHCVCGSATCSGEGHDKDQVWTAWESTNSLPQNAGFYYLTDDVTLTSDQSAEDGVNLCLNGHTVDLKSYKYYCGSGTLIVTNCKETGGFKKESVSQGDYYINAKNLTLYNISFTGTGNTGSASMVGYGGGSSTNTSTYHIENCSFSNTGLSGGTNYAVNIGYAGDVTIKNTQIDLAGSGPQTGIRIPNMYGSLSMDNTSVSVDSDAKNSYNSYAGGLSINCYNENPANTISDSSFTVTGDYSGNNNSTNVYGVYLNGYAGYTFDKCVISAETKKEGESYGIYSNECPVTLRNGCEVSVSATLGTNTTQTYGIYVQNTDCTVDGSKVTASNSGNGEAKGIYLYATRYDELHIVRTLNVTDSTVTGLQHGIYNYASRGGTTINIKNSSVEASLDTASTSAIPNTGYGIYNSSNWEDQKLYIGGSSSVTGITAGMNIKRMYSGETYRDYAPAVYAASTDETALTLDGDKKLSLFCDSRSDQMRTGDPVIVGNTMTQALTGKIIFVYPEKFIIKSDGTLDELNEYSIVLINGVTGAASYGAYDSPVYDSGHSIYKAITGKKVYLNAVPAAHYVFDKWIVESGGVSLDNASSAQTFFAMGTSNVYLKPSFKEADSYTISYKGGSGSDGTVKDFTGKKYHGEAATLATKVFKNKDASRSQTGWSTTDGGAKVYDLGGSYETDSDITLYPYWQGNHTITIKYGNYPPEGHTSDETVFSDKKIPYKDYSFIGRDIDDKFGYPEGGSGVSTYYYREAEDGTVYKLRGLSKDPAGTTCDYRWISGYDNTKYTVDEDITLYPYWERFYRISYAPGIYGVEREEPLPDQFKDAGASVTLPGRITTDNVKITAYERREQDRDQYSQGGWSVNPDGSTRDYALAGKYSENEDVILYPYWEPIYKITYLPGEHGTAPGGEEEIVVKKYVGVEYNIYYGLFTRTGCTQTGWNTKEDGTGTAYAFNSKYKGDANLTLYPVWSENYSITYVPDERCAQTAPVMDTKVPGNPAKIRGNIFSAKGYKIKGYTTTEGGTEVDYQAGDTYDTDADLILYPVLEPEAYALWLGNTQVNTDNKGNILGDGKASFDPDTQTLKLKGVNITDYHSVAGEGVTLGTGISAMSFPLDGEIALSALNLVIEGENTVIPNYAGSVTGCGIDAEGLDVTVSGTGTLAVGKNDPAYNMVAGLMGRSLRMKGATLNIYGNTAGSYFEYPQNGRDAITIEGGILNSTALGDAGIAVGCMAGDAAAFRMSGGEVNLTTTGNKMVISGEESFPSALAARAAYSDGVILEGGTLRINNIGNDGYGIEFSNYGEGEGDEGSGENQHKGISFYAGDITISSKTAAVATELFGRSFTGVHIGNGVTVKAGADAGSASDVNDFATNYANYKYAKFSGGTAPDRTYLYVGNEAVTSSRPEGEGFSYDPGTATLTLNDLDLATVYEEKWGNNTYTYGIYCENDLNLELKGASSVGFSDTAADTGIYVGGRLNVTGSGYLDVYGSDNAVNALGDISVTSATIDARSDGYGLFAESDLTIESGRISAESTGDDEGYSYGIYCGDGLTVNDGKVTASGKDDGIYSFDDVNIIGGEVTVTSPKMAVECDNYFQSGGEVILVSTGTGEDALDHQALNPVYTTTLTGGKLYAEARYTAIKSGDTNQRLNVYGGLLKAHSRSTERYGGSGMTTTIQYKNVTVDGGRLEVSGYGYGIYGDRNSTSPNVSITGGSMLIDMTESKDGRVNYAVAGKVNVNMSSSRYCKERGGKTYIRTGSYSITCNANAADDGTDHVNISAVQTVTYKPGTFGTGDEISVAKDAGVSLKLKGAVFTREGFVQTGWNTEDAGNGVHYDLLGEYSQESDIIVYPEWAQAKKITYKPGLASETAEYTDPAAVGRKTQLRGQTYTRDKYIQTSWNTMADGTGTSYDLSGEITVTADVTLYPGWTRAEEIKYTLSFNKGLRGKGEDPEDVRLGIGESHVLPGVTYTSQGFEHIGWTRTEDGEKEYELGGSITIGKDTTLFPAWQAVQPGSAYGIVIDGAKTVKVKGSNIPVFVLCYTGNALKPEVKVYDDKTLLTPKKDYTISFKNNTNADMTAADLAVERGIAVTDPGSGISAKELKKLPAFTITGKGNYGSTETVYFSIEPASLENGEFTASDDFTFEYAEKKGKPVINKPLPIVSGTLDGKTKKLKKGKDYTVKYYLADLDAEGKYRIDGDGHYKCKGNELEGLGTKGYYVVKTDGTGNYSGTITVKAMVTDKKSITKAKVTFKKSLPYNNGAEVKQTDVKVKYGSAVLTENTDYVISYENNREVGTAFMYVEGKGDYAGRTCVSYSITGIPMSKVRVEGLVNSFEYDGTAKLQNGARLSVKQGSMDVGLVNGTDYTVEYKNNVNAGNNAEVIFTGKGVYSGVLKKKYKIMPFDMSKNNGMRIKADVEGSTAYAKGGAMPDVSVEFTTGNGSKAVLGPDDYALSFKDNKAVNDGSGNKKPTVFVTGKGNFKGKMTAGTFAITPKSFDDVDITVFDKAYENKKDNYVTQMIGTDTDGNDLKAGTDWDKNVIYKYDQDVTVTNNKKPADRKKGDTVTKGDIVPEGTRMKAVIIAKGNYTGRFEAGFSIKSFDISKAKVEFTKKFYYDKGTPITPGKDDFKLSIKIGREWVEVPSNEYRIVPGSYKKNTGCGTAVFMIAGTDNSAGVLTVKYIILPRVLEQLFG